MITTSKSNIGDFQTLPSTASTPSPTMALPHDALDIGSDHPTLPPIITSQHSPKSIQAIQLQEPRDVNELIKQPVSSQSSVNSISSRGSSDFGSLGDSDTQETSPIYVKGLLERANTILEEDQVADDNVREILVSLSDSLGKLRAEANRYKIKSELLSISSRDADMRYEVENELIKREVDRLKNQEGNIDYLMNKIDRQKQTLKKYKNEIMNKNKEIIQLRSQRPNGASHALNSSSALSTFKNRKKRKNEESSSGSNYGLNTLGMLASQVLTEEEKLTQSFPR